MAAPKKKGKAKTGAAAGTGGEMAAREGGGATIVEATEARRPSKPGNWGTMTKTQQRNWLRQGGKRR